MESGVKITVTWMNGQRETYRCKQWVVEDGILLWLDPEGDYRSDNTQPARCIPLSNVQIWTLDA